jgi:hypothetical protein
LRLAEEAGRPHPARITATWRFQPDNLEAVTIDSRIGETFRSTCQASPY